MRATSSSGWQGLVIQSSAPPRRPRTRSATGAGRLQASRASPGIRWATHSRYSRPVIPGLTMSAWSLSAASWSGEAA